MLNLPLACPLKNNQFNPELMLSELDSIPKEFFYRTGCYRPNRVFNDQEFGGWYVGTLEQMQNVDYFYQNGEEHVFINGSISGWNIVKLRELNNEPLSLHQNKKKLADGSWYTFRLQKDWVWRSFVDHMPYTKQIIEALPFDPITNIRVLYLEEGSIGPAHSDEVLRTYQQNNITAINLTVLTGGVPLEVLTPSGEIDLDDPLYQFNNHYPHGVPMTTSKRVTIQIEGFYNDDFMDYLDLDKAIWP